jgi:hypothetical protein
MGSFDAKKRHQKSHAWAPLKNNLTFPLHSVKIYI